MFNKFLLLVSLIFTIAINGFSYGIQKFNTTKNNLFEISNIDPGDEKAPDFILYTVDGIEVKLSNYLGKVVILDFWAMWCAPCRRAIPDLVSIQNEFKDELVIIGISLDQPATQDDLVPFIKYYGINYPVVLGNIEVSDAYGNIQGIPTSFIIDREGKIINKHIGLVPKSTLIEEINLLLK